MTFIEILNNSTSIQTLVVFLISMAPIGELRFSIPYGILATDLNTTTVVLLSITGNVLVGAIIIYILPLLLSFILKIKIFRQTYFYISKRTYSRSKIIQQRKYYGLIFFVSLPLPFTGVWTGALASNLLGLSKRKSISAVFFGVCISASIVTLLVNFGILTYLKIV